ncbi:MAG: tetratricopeptide repeat protein [Gemmatimonadota bacterium]
MASTLTAQPTAPASATDRSLAWAQANRKLLLIAGSVLAAAILVVWFLATARSRREEFASRSLSQARNIAESGNIPQASTEYQKLIDTYAGTAAAQDAEIAINQLRLISGQAELAIGRLRDYLKKNPEPQYAAAANGLLGAALENVNRFVEAGDAYAAASQAAGVDYLKADYLVQAGRAYANAGKSDQAIASYRTVIDKYPKTGPFTEAQVRLAELTKGTM